MCVLSQLVSGAREVWARLAPCTDAPRATRTIPREAARGAGHIIARGMCWPIGCDLRHDFPERNLCDQIGSVRFPADAAPRQDRPTAVRFRS
jgi:hypothetical protein